MLIAPHLLFPESWTRFVLGGDNEARELGTTIGEATV